MAPRCIHIAVLDTDVPVPTVYAARGLYSSQFGVLLQAAAARLNASSFFNNNNSDTVEVHTTAYDVVGGTLPPLSSLRTQPQNQKREYEYEYEYDESPRCGRSGLDFIDAILITGSSASAYRLDRYPWIGGLQSFIQTVYAEYPEVQIFGSCFGHQIVAQALLSHHHHHGHGSDDEGNYVSVAVAACPEGYEVGIHPVTLNPAFVRYFPPLRSRLPHCQGRGQGQGQTMKLQLIHGDRVTLLPSRTNLPSPWLSIGSTAKSPIQGLYHPGRVLTYQGHFEFDAWVNRETCIEFARREGWSATDLSLYLAQIGEPGSEDDAKIAAEVVVMFLAGIDVVDKQEKSVGGVVHAQQNGGGAVSRNGLITPPLVDDNINEQIVDINMMA